MNDRQRFALGILWMACGASIVAGCVTADGTYRELSDARQVIYQHGVPHTDRNGRMQLEADEKSFLPRCAYESLPGMLADLRRAGFNCFKPWNGLSIQAVLPEARASQMQLIKQLWILPCDFQTHPDCDPSRDAARQIATLADQVAKVADSANILGWYIEEEPTSCVNAGNCQQRFENFKQFKAAIHAVDPLHPSFSLDISLPKPAALRAWSEFNGSGDVAAIDNYPFHHGDESSLEDSAANYQRLVALNHEKKPVWITVQDFGTPPDSAGTPWVLPAPQQMRAEVFTALVHGATGIVFFALDSWASRNALVIGIAAKPASSYPGAHAQDAVATPAAIAASQNLWNETVSLNAEIDRLQRVLLSPTAALAYSVGIRGRAITTTPIRSLLKKSRDGVYTLLVVNIDNVPLSMLFTFPETPLDLHSIDASGSRQAMDLTGKSIAYSIEGFGVRVYEFR